MPKKDADLLGPIGNEGTDYIRGRLKKRVMLELGITMRKNQVRALLSCLDKATTFARVSALHDEVAKEIMSPVWALEIEPLMIEFHGAWRYDGRPDVLKKDLSRAANHYAVSHTMDSLLSQCGFQTVRTREERLDDAAHYAIPARERG